MAKARAWSLTVGVLHAAVAVFGAWLVTQHGGSIDRAPQALTIAVMVLAGSGFCAGVAHGLEQHRTGLIAEAVTSFALFYCSTWVFSNAHSLAGDTSFLAVSAIPAALGAACGYSTGNLIHRANTRLAARTIS